MRILVLSDLPQFVTGGAERQAANLIEAWLDAGHEVTCFGRRMGASQVTIGAHTIQVRKIHTLQRCGRALRAASYFVSLARLLFLHRQRFDVIYTRFLGEAAATAALMKSLRMLDVPLVSTPANTGGEGDANFLAGLPFHRRLVRLLDAQCNAINLIAPAMADELRRIGFSGQNFSQIPNGVSIHDAPSGAQPRRHSMVAVGRLTPQKGYDVLIDALALNRANLRSGVVRIIGDGPDREALQAQARDMRVDHAITWLGELSHDDALLEMEHAQVFLLPSRYEGMSNAGLEAMEKGLAMLATRCGGLDTFIQQDMGWIVEPGDVGSLSLALQQVLRSPASQLVGMGSKNRALVIQEFGMTAVADRYLTLFNRLVERRRTKSES